MRVTAVDLLAGPDVGLMRVRAGVTYSTWSPLVIGLVQMLVVTRTSTVPAAPAGTVAETFVFEITRNVVAGVAPNATALAPVNPEPVMVTVVPPPVGADAGDTLVTAGPT
jgi:hypothetical protein